MKFRCPNCGSEAPAMLRTDAVTANTNPLADEWVIDPNTTAYCDPCLHSDNLYKFYEKPTLYVVEHTHEDKGDGGSSFYVVKGYPGRNGVPCVSDVLETLDIDYDPELGEGLDITRLGDTDEDLAEVNMGV